LLEDGWEDFEKADVEEGTGAAGVEPDAVPAMRFNLSTSALALSFSLSFLAWSFWMDCKKRLRLP